MGEPLPLVALTEEALWLLLETFQLRLVRFTRGIVGNVEDARDIVQDVFVNAWRTAQRPAAPFTRGSGVRDVQRWLFRAAYNKAIDIVRHRSVIAWETLDPFNPLDLVVPQESLPFEERLAEGEVLRAALAHLEPQDVACLRLSIIEDFTSVEIAQILDITPEATRKRLSRATQRLRAAYLVQTGRSQSSSPPVSARSDTSGGRRER